MPERLTEPPSACDALPSAVLSRSVTAELSDASRCSPPGGAAPVSYTHLTLPTTPYV